MTPYMDLVLPTVSVTLGPEWATELNAALTLVDSHNHTSGKGVPITTAAIDINADLDFNSYKAIGLAGVTVENQSSLTTANTYGAVAGNPIYANGSISNLRLVNVSYPMVVGDIIYASSTTAFGRLAIGSTGQILQVAGGLPSWQSVGSTLVVSTQTGATFTASVTIGLYLCNPSGNQAVTLPVSSGSGHSFVFKNTAANFNIITISRSSSDVIVDAASSVTSTTLNTLGEEIEIVDAVSGTWQVINRRIPSIWTAYSLTIGGSTTAPTLGTTTTNQAYWKRVGDSMMVKYDLVQTVAGSAGSGTYIFPIPSGPLINTTVTPGSTTTGGRGVVGSATLSDAANGLSAQSVAAQVQVYSTTGLTMASPGTGGNVLADSESLVGSGGNYAISNTNVVISFIATVPITGWNG